MQRIVCDDNDDLAVIYTVQVIGKRGDLGRRIRIPATPSATAGFSISAGTKAVDAVVASFVTLQVFKIYLRGAVLSVRIIAWAILMVAGGIDAGYASLR